ncbi:hypothetical protein S83_014594 [Arachis hypogaea]
MAPGPGCTSQTTMLSGGGGVGCVDNSTSNESAMEDQNGDTVGNLIHNIGKPPRDHSVMRHCTSSSWLIEPESDIMIVGLKTTSEEKSEFSPKLRSGSCSEKGPKQYMEDEFICVDILREHTGPSVNLPSPAAFYGR